MKCMCVCVYVCMYVRTYVDSIVRESPTTVLVMLIGDTVISLGCALLLITQFPFRCLLKFLQKVLNFVIVTYFLILHCCCFASFDSLRMLQHLIIHLRVYCKDCQT